MPSSDYKPQLSERNKELIVYLGLLCLPPLFFWRATLGWLTLSDGDAIFWFYPAYQFVAAQLRAGALPLWNPYLYSGAPLFAQWQAGALDPFNWLFLTGVTSRTLTLAQELAYAVALLGMFAYARSLGLRRRAGVCAAVIYGLSGFAVARVIYPGFLHIFAITPLVLWTIERLRQRPAWRTAALGALFVAWQLFAAHPQPFVYCALLALAYALFRLSERWRRGDGLRANGLFIGQLALLYGGGLALAALQMLPALETARQSVRQAWAYEQFTLNSLHPSSLLVTLFPFWHGQGQGIYRMKFWGLYWHQHEAQIYLGALALALACAGAYAAWRWRWGIGRFWSVLALVGALLSLGRYVEPLARALHKVPLIGQFRSPNRFWMAVVFAVAVLAGFAVDRLLCAKEKELQRTLARNAQFAALLLVIICALVGGVALWRSAVAERFLLGLRDMNWVQPGFLQQGSAEFYLPIITAIVLGGVLLLFVRASARWYALLLAALLGDYQLYAHFAPITNAEPHLENQLGRAMPPSLAVKQSEREPIRYHQLLNPATGEFNPFWLYGHELATGYDPVLNTRYKTFTGIDEAGRSYLPTLLKREDQTLDLLNVHYVLVSPNFFPSPEAANDAGLADGERWREVPNDSAIRWYDRMKLYENLRAMPRVWLVDEVWPVRDEYDQLRLIRGELKNAQRRAFDPRRAALAETQEAQAAWYRGFVVTGEAERELDGGAQIIARQPGRLLIETEANKAALLVLSEIAYPGWQATVNGQPVVWQRVNYMLCGVPVAAGKHRVEFVYRPASIKIGAVVTLTTALGLLCLIAWESWRRRTLRGADA
jgi:hypothetical protein